MKKIIPFVFIIVSVFAIQGCQKTSDAEDVVDKFYSCLEENDYDGLVEFLDEETIEMYSEEVIISTMKERNEFWGDLKDRKKTFTEIKTNNGQTKVVLRYDVENENGKTHEEFELLENDGEFKISYYEYKSAE
ncbi:MAG: hypothetical protein C0596_10015 [Marinilabiliales bacterium]|nr:MAG: hypothetical protein C0596_10015 [Marinilabiliales bacterium]